MLLNSFGGRLLPKSRRTPQRAAEAAAGKKEVSPAEAKTEIEAMEQVPPSAPAQVILDVPDIHCGGCENNIKTLLGSREGVDAVEADAKTHRVRVAYQPERVGLHEIEEAVISLGFRVQRAHARRGNDA